MLGFNTSAMAFLSSSLFSWNANPNVEFASKDVFLDNGLAIKPPMGWNSYNHYACAPNETIIRSNAQALVDSGLQARGYHFVVVDCGWTLPNRTTEGTLTWNPSRFPNGYPALGEFIHSLELGFGVYSDGGIKTCMLDEPEQAGSLHNEYIDAETFASWGADLLKYDNCFSDPGNDFPMTSYSPAQSPQGNYVTMSAAISATNRPILYQICDWGLDFPSAWAPAIGNTWRITNDITESYRTIPRILNQAVPQTSYAGPGHWLDLDMLQVGNNIFTIAEEQTHFSLWAIIKSPLMIGAALKDGYSHISVESLAILENLDVISYNQDSLGVAAHFVRRWTEDEYELWTGPLSQGRFVVALINLKDEPRELTLNLPDVGFQKAGSVKDIWRNITTTNVLTSYTAPVRAHGTILLELNDTTTKGEYNVRDALVSEDRTTTTFTNVYGLTSSSNYEAKIAFSDSHPESQMISINGLSYIIPPNLKSSMVSIALRPSADNIITVSSSVPVESLSVGMPHSVFYSSTSFTPNEFASHKVCHTKHCTPVGSKIGNLSSQGFASLSVDNPFLSAGPKFVEVYFCNNDVALESAWDLGSNTRNMTLAVNGVETRIELPLSGRSSELFSLGNGWEDTGVFGVLVDGWTQGSNSIVIGNAKGDEGLVKWGADFVGLNVFW